jgi:hypothetical protein
MLEPRVGLVQSAPHTPSKSASDSSILQNFKIFTHLWPNFSYKDPRLTEVRIIYLGLGMLEPRVGLVQSGLHHHLIEN